MIPLDKKLIIKIHLKLSPKLEDRRLMQKKIMIQVKVANGISPVLYHECITFSETLLLLPFKSSGAIHGKVPRTPPDTNVFLLIFDKPKSPT